MLTEKIMHECIKKLLADVAAPKQEDLECLTKLMSTVGLQLDNPNAKQSKMYMDAYFERIMMLTRNQSLESRIRFMLQVSYSGPLSTYNNMHALRSAMSSQCSYFCCVFVSCMGTL